MDLITIEQYDSYLEHHGILGQKWGKRQGPPYPLGASDHSAAEKKAGWRDSLNKTDGDKNRQKAEAKRSSSSDGKKRGLSDNQKRALMVGAAVAGTALAAYGVYKFKNFVDDDTAKKAMNIGEQILDRRHKEWVGTQLAELNYDMEKHLERFDQKLNEQTRAGVELNNIQREGKSIRDPEYRQAADKWTKAMLRTNAEQKRWQDRLENYNYAERLYNEATRSMADEAIRRYETRPFTERAAEAITTKRRTRRAQKK